MFLGGCLGLSVGTGPDGPCFISKIVQVVVSIEYCDSATKYDIIIKGFQKPAHAILMRWRLHAQVDSTTVAAAKTAFFFGYKQQELFVRFFATIDRSLSINHAMPVQSSY